MSQEVQTNEHRKYALTCGTRRYRRRKISPGQVRLCARALRKTAPALPLSLEVGLN